MTDRDNQNVGVKTPADKSSAFSRAQCGDAMEASAAWQKNP
jgi:hypothetical protein